MINEDRILKVNINEEMRSSYLDYSMSVIVARALPDVRDGFKPVHRRVLYGMEMLGNTHDKPTKKCARIVGEVMGKLHPHGDSSIYGTLVRMAQPWAMRYPLVAGQGNFGTIDGDGAAAMRYTEAKLTELAEEMLRDIEKDTVDMQYNFDDTIMEPTVLPTRFPNLLVNGSSGIAVGMATNMPTHNLSEVIDGCVAYIEDTDITVEGLMKYIKAPDFPTGGTIYGYQGVRDAYETGRGRIVIRSEATIETNAHGGETIRISELPYGVIKSDLVKNIANLVRDKKIEGISDIADYSKKGDIRIVIEIKRDASANVVLNKLYKYTQLQSSFSVNNVAIVKGVPQEGLTLKDLVSNFVEHRMDIVTRRTRYELKKAEERMHIVEGLIIAVNNIDEVVAIIRASRTPADAQRGLEARFQIDELQSKAIVDMRLGQLTGLRIDELHKEHDDLERLIEHLNDILSSEEMRYDIIKDELLEIKAKYGDERRTRIELMATEFNPEDMYADDDMVITISHLGYIKRTPLAEFRQQGRGGVGVKASSSRDEDFMEYIHTASMHSTMMFFTEIGRCYWMKVYDIPEGTRTSKGRPIQNFISLDKGDKIRAFLNVKGLNDSEFVTNHYLVFITKNGLIKKTTLEAYSHPRKLGVNAINLREGDQLLRVCLTSGQSDILVASYNGKVCRFKDESIRAMGRNASGVRAISLDEDGVDRVIGMACVEPVTENENGEKTEQKSVLVISENGYGKRSLLDDENGEQIYRLTRRGAKGVRTMNITEKTGNLIAIDTVSDADDLMLINRSGTAIRLDLASIRIMGRATQGVRIINLTKRNDQIAFGCIVPKDEECTSQKAEMGDELPPVQETAADLDTTTGTEIVE